MAQPDNFPTWATNLEVDPIFGENRLEPTEEFKDSGVKGQQPWSRAFLNYQLWLINEWVVHFQSEIDNINNRLDALENP